jgi:TolB protein
MLGKVPRPVFPSLPTTIPLPDLLRRSPAIAYFGYSVTGYEGETGSQEDIFEVSSVTGTVHRITDDRTLPYFKSDRDPAWSPNRSRLAIHAASDLDPTSRLFVIARSTGAVVEALVPGVSPAWLDASTLLYLDTVDPGTDHARNDVFCLDIPSRTTRRITDVGVGADLSGFSWHATAGLALAYGSQATDRYAVAVVPAASVGAARAPGGVPVPGAAFGFVTGPALRAGAPDWSPTANRIALSTWTPGSPSRVGYLTVATGAVTLVPGPAEAGLSDAGAVFSPDGASLAFTRGYEDEWTEIWLYAMRGRRLRQLTDDGRQRFKGALDW